MPDHMAPQRLEATRRDERGHPAPASRRPATSRSRHDVPDYDVVQYPTQDYPDRLDDDLAPQYRPRTEDRGSYFPEAGAPSPDGLSPRLRLDRGEFNLPPIELNPALRSSSRRLVPPPPAMEPDPEPEYAQESEAAWESEDRHDESFAYSMQAEPVEAESAEAEPAEAEPESVVTMPNQVNTYASDPASGDPSLVAHYRDLRDQLMRTIQLYNDDWRLGGIRTSETKLVAYLTPRDKKLDLREAIHRREVLVIIVDSRGNTDIKEPRPRNFLQRLFTWLIGE